MNASVRSLLRSAGMVLAASPAYAVDTAKVYNSGWLVLGFLGFLALIVLIQVFPALMMLVGMVRGLFKGTSKQAAAEETVAGKG